jgi:hypothetical protein
VEKKLSRWAHNSEIGGASPPSAIIWIGGEAANAEVCKTSIHGFESHPVLNARLFRMSVNVMWANVTPACRCYPRRIPASTFARHANRYGSIPYVGIVGKLPEWSIGAALKADGLHRHGGSTPSLSV